MRVRWQLEIQPYACRVLEKHWPDVKKYGDITTVDGTELERVDVLCGGFPCQDLSYAGVGAGIHASRSGLYAEMLRLARDIRPRYLLMENVAALLARGLGVVLADLAESGYDAEWDCIPASALGAHHQRDRVFIVAYPMCVGGPGLGRPEADRRGEHQSGPDPKVLEGGREVLSGPLADTTLERFWNDPVWNRRGGLESGDLHDPPVDRGLHGRAEPGWPAEPDVGRVADGVPARVDRLRGLGNAVVPQVGELLGRLIIRHHENKGVNRGEEDSEQ